MSLRRVQWARQVGALNLLPTCSMLTLLDKKFGGELTKEDVQVAFCCANSTNKLHFCTCHMSICMHYTMYGD